MESDREEEGQSRTPLEDLLLKRQQRQLEVINAVNGFIKVSAVEQSKALP